MPMYDYKCPVCGRGREVILKLEDINSSVFCQSCGHAMNRQISAPRVFGDYPGYECPVTGKWIEGRRAHQENLARTGCRVLEPGETAAYQKRLAKEDEEFERKIETTADELITNLPPEKKERLAAEMGAGVSAEVVRLGSGH